MNSQKLFSITALVLAAFAVAGTARAQAGTIQFNVVMTPASGHPEPTMGQMIYLLRESFATTRKQAEAEETKPDFDKFVDNLAISPELKTWMKKNKAVAITGQPFHDALKPEDMVGVPEFLSAYVETNLVESEGFVGFPTPKYRPKDKLTKPEKYELQRKNYIAALRKYYEKNPHSADTMDVHLAEWDHSAEWNRLMDGWTRRSRERALQYSQTREFVAKAETDLQGRGSFRVAPGTYWLSTLEGYAVAGDLRMQWDVPVIVADGMVTRVELSNTNAERPPR